MCSTQPVWQYGLPEGHSEAGFREQDVRNGLGCGQGTGDGGKEDCMARGLTVQEPLTRRAIRAGLSWPGLYSCLHPL